MQNCVAVHRLVVGNTRRAFLGLAPPRRSPWLGLQSRGCWPRGTRLRTTRAWGAIPHPRPGCGHDHAALRLRRERPRELLRSVGPVALDGKCITLFDDNCVSIAEQHPEVTQGVVDFASGVLEVNPFTATTNALGWSDTSQYANEGSGTFNAGMLSMVTFNAAYVYVSPGTATALAWHGGGMAGINCARQGLGSMACQYGAFTSVVGALSVLGNWFDLPSVRSFYNMLAALMGAHLWARTVDRQWLSASGSFLVFAVLLYGGARLAPPLSDAELDRRRAELGDRAGERHRQMELQRRYTLAIGRIAIPLAVAGLVISLVVEVVS